MNTVGELIKALQDLDPDTVLRVAHQPTWPLRECVGWVVTPNDFECEDCNWTGEHSPECPVREFPTDGPDNGDIAWIVLGGHPGEPESPYAPNQLWGR